MDVNSEQKDHNGCYYYNTLVDFLCIIHRDGGHYLDKHGMDKSIKDARKIILPLLQDKDNE